MGRLRRLLRWVIKGREHGLRAWIFSVLRNGSEQESPVAEGREPETEQPGVGAWARICSSDEVGEGEAVEVFVNDLPFAVAKLEGTVYVLAGTCPHAGGPLGEGLITGDHLVCPWHGWSYGLSDGSCAIDDNLSVQIYETKIEDGTVYAKIVVEEAE